MIKLCMMKNNLDIGQSHMILHRNLHHSILAPQPKIDKFELTLFDLEQHNVVAPTFPDPRAASAIQSNHFQYKYNMKSS